MKVFRKILVLVLVALVGLSAIAGLAPNTASAEGQQSLTIHMKKPAGWDSISMYYYGTDPKIDEPKWDSAPAMTPEGDDWYVYTIQGATSANVIFKDGSGNQIPPKLEKGILRDKEGWFDGTNWSDVSQNPVVTPTATPTFTPTPTPTATPTYTPTPKVTATPTFTPTPQVSSTPEVTPTPKVTSTPKPTQTATPKLSPTPKSTPKPTSTPGYDSNINFKDIEKHWAKASIMSLVDMGIITGYPDGTIKPDSQITREEFLVILCKAVELSPVKQFKLEFGDTADISAWSKGYVQAAVEKGIITGFEDNTFRPSQNLTRKEMVVMTMKAFGIDKPKSTKIGFADSAQIPDWAKDYVAAAYESKIIKGFKGNKFCPDNTVTRAEVFALIDRCLQVIQ